MEGYGWVFKAEIGTPRPTMRSAWCTRRRRGLPVFVDALGEHAPTLARAVATLVWCAQLARRIIETRSHRCTMRT